MYSSAWRLAVDLGTALDSLTDTDEWTYEPETTDYAGAYPYGWCLDSRRRAVRAVLRRPDQRQQPDALMWQWSGGGGVTNGIGGFNGDLDTIDAIRLP